MTIRTVLNPYGGIPPIVDARIGTAYAVVEICVLNLEAIIAAANEKDNLKLVTDNLLPIVAVGNNISNVNVVASRYQSEVVSRITGVAGAIGAQVTLPWPAGVTSDEVLASSVMIRGTNGWIYHQSSVTFLAAAKPAGLEVVVQPGATTLPGGTINWYLTHTP